MMTSPRSMPTWCATWKTRTTRGFHAIAQALSCVSSWAVSSREPCALIFLRARPRRRRSIQKTRREPGELSPRILGVQRLVRKWGFAHPNQPFLSALRRRDDPVGDAATQHRVDVLPHRGNPALDIFPAYARHMWRAHHVLQIQQIAAAV